MDRPDTNQSKPFSSPELLALWKKVMNYLENLPWMRVPSGRREVNGRKETLDEHSNHVADVLRENSERRQVIEQVKARGEEIKAQVKAEERDKLAP